MLVTAMLCYSACVDEATACNALALADLTSASIDTNFDNTEDVAVLTTINNIINVLQDVLGCDAGEANATAGAHGYLEQIVYSANGTFNDGIIVSEEPIENPPLEPGMRLQTLFDYNLLVDGSYAPYYFIDHRDDINERTENNNGELYENKTTLLQARAVRVSGKAKAPSIDENGHPVYLRLLSAPVVKILTAHE